jgi:2-polyprenyl-3-methyl-5-hydroxy-6-metoxy-1,4-benzoquinol methylase
MRIGLEISLKQTDAGDAEILRSAMTNTQTLNEYINAQYTSAPQAIDIGGSASQLKSLFKRIQGQWTRLGENDPHWSVITEDRFRSSTIKENIREFNESGRGTANLLKVFANRSGVDISRGACLELGCGVGRITRFLAEQFDTVTAIDISKGNLRACKAYLSESSIENVETLLLAEPGQIREIEEFDVFVSFIVLQHNPPPVQRFLLQQILSKIRRGGVCLFQTPTHIRGYRFAIDDYLGSPDQTMEMHCLPMSEVLSILQMNGFRILEVLQDSWAGESAWSHTFFAIRS